LTPVVRRPWLSGGEAGRLPLWERLSAAIGWVAAGRSALQRLIVASLIVEREAWPFGGVLVESPGGLPVGEGR
jgi:hypothetical protein